MGDAMETTGAARRVRWEFADEVRFPPAFARYLWDHPDGRAPREKVVLRVLSYGRFQEIRRLFRRYPREAVSVADRYPGIRRGVRYWIGRWRRAGA